VTERKPPGMPFETWVDSQITRGIARGDFDDLPGAGKPLPSRSGDDSMVAWVIEKAKQENIDVFDMLPPGLALRKEREDLPRRAAALPSEAAVRALVEEFNDRVRLFWRRLAAGPPGAGGARGAPARAPPPVVRPLAVRPARMTVMRFVLEVDLDAGALAGDNRAAELGRILRYWGGWMKQVSLEPGSRQELSDSDYAVVGEWRIEN
jgi:hypothetical protein